MFSQIKKLALLFVVFLGCFNGGFDNMYPHSTLFLQANGDFCQAGVSNNLGSYTIPIPRILVGTDATFWTSILLDGTGLDFDTANTFSFDASYYPKITVLGTTRLLIGATENWLEGTTNIDGNVRIDSYLTINLAVEDTGTPIYANELIVIADDGTFIRSTAADDFSVVGVYEELDTVIVSGVCDVYLDSSAASYGYQLREGTTTPGTVSGIDDFSGQPGRLLGVCLSGAASRIDFTVAKTDVNTTDDEITVDGNDYVVDDRVVYLANSGASIGGLSDGNAYYVVSIDRAVIQLASTVGGDPIDLTSTGNSSQALNITRLVSCRLF